MMKRRLLAMLLTICMVVGMGVPAGAAGTTTTAAAETSANAAAEVDRSSVYGTPDGPVYTPKDHVIDSSWDWRKKNILVMPGEKFYVEPEFTTSTSYCTCAKVDGTWVSYTTSNWLQNVDLYLGSPDGSIYAPDPHVPRTLTDKYLMTSKWDSSKLGHIYKDFNVVQMALDQGAIAASSFLNNEQRKQFEESVKAAVARAGHNFHIGYVNNTGLPMKLTSAYKNHRYNPELGVGISDGWHLGHDAVSNNYGWGLDEFFVSVYEPYYTITYEDIDCLTPEQQAALPDRYFIQRETQQLVLPVPTSPGEHFKYWENKDGGYHFKLGDTKVEDGNITMTFDMDDLSNVAKDLVLEPYFEWGHTLTLNPNGGSLKDGEKTIREVDKVTYDGDDPDNYDSCYRISFEANTVVPVREGYTFTGWYMSPDCTEETLVTGTTSRYWLRDWEDYCNSVITAKYSDIQLYAGWAKNDAAFTNKETGISVALANKVSETAALTVNTLTAENVWKAYPEFKDQLRGLQLAYDLGMTDNGQALDIKNNPMTVTIPLNDQLKGYDFYHVVELGKEATPFDVTIKNGSLRFETDHLGRYAVLGSNIPYDPVDPSVSQFFDYRFVTEDTIEIMGYRGEETTLIIPSKLDGYTVVGIADMGLPTRISTSGKPFNKVETVYVPDTVKYIKEFACYNEVSNVYNLKKVVLPEGLESIGAYAFASAPQLEEINFPSTLKYLGECAFEGTSLRDMTLPEGVEQIGAFRRTPALQDKIYDVKINGGDPFIIVGGELVAYVGDDPVVNVPNGVRSIGREVFSFRKYPTEDVTTVTLPDSVEIIEDCAFFDQKALTTINFGKGLKEIMGGAFQRCTSLNNVNIPEGVKEIGSGAFGDCTSLTNITFPSTLEVMYTSSTEGTPFFDNLPNGENYLGGMFFYKYIAAEGEGSSSGAVSHINVRPGTLGLMAPFVEGVEFAPTYTLPDGLRYIGTGALEGATGDLILPDSVTVIAGRDYYGGGNGEVPAEALKHGLPASLTYIGDYAFSFASTDLGISCLEIPNGVTYIGERAFKGINHIDSETKMDVRLPDSLEYMGGDAFGLNNIGEVTNWPAAITTWGDFLGNCKMDNLTLPDTIFNVDHLSTGFIESPTAVVNLNRTKVVTGLVAVDFSTTHWDAEKDEWVENNMENYTATILMPNVERLVEANVGTNAKGVLALPEKRPVVIGKGSYGDLYENLTIVTYNDSMLKDPFAPVPSEKTGDADKDGSITASDALAVLKHTVKLQLLDENGQKLADVNKDGKVDASDALGILKYVVKLITSFEEL